MFDIEKSSATYKSPLLTFPACSLLSYTQIDRRILGTRLIFFIIYYYIYGYYDYLYTGCLSLEVLLTCAFFESKELISEGPKKN